MKRSLERLTSVEYQLLLFVKSDDVREVRIELDQARVDYRKERGNWSKSTGGTISNQDSCISFVTRFMRQFLQTKPRFYVLSCSSRDSRAKV